MEVFASLFGGLGLFFIGIKAVGANLQQLAGRRVRAVVAAATRGRFSTAAVGTLLGALTQSTNAVTFIATSMVTAGVLPLARALPVVGWANLGTAALVMLATVDLRLGALWLLGVVGFGTYFNLDHGGRLRPALGALNGLALLFLGLAVIKSGAAPLREAALVRELLAFAGDALAPPFVVGLAVTLVAQSSSTVSILALTLNAVGLLGFDQTVMVVYGASLGSGLSVLLLSGNLQGSARRLAVYQALFKAAGTVLFLALFAAEHWGGVPLVIALTGALAEDPQHRIGWLFLLLQLGTALALAPFGRPALALLARLCPPTPAEALSRPQYLYEQALDDAPTALDLVEREQQRLLERLPMLLDALREDGPRPTVSRRDLLAAGAAVEAEVGRFLADLLERGCARESLERAVALENRNALLGSLRETVGEFADALETARATGSAAALTPVLERLAEALHLLLTELDEAAHAGGAAAASVLRDLTSDRSDMMDGLRRRVARAEPSLAYDGQELLFRATSLFERAVWLIRRKALLFASANGTAEPA